VTQKPCSKEEKKKLVESVKGKSKRDCEKIFEEIAPETAKKIQIEVSPELHEKLKRIQSLTSHKNKSVAEALDWMAEKILNRIEPIMASPENETVLQSSGTRYVPALIKQAVWTRDQGRCGFVDARSKRRCNSTYALELDHIVPYAKGGLTELRNLRLRCRAHNQHHAIQSFGLEKMARYITKG
jgi:5-methylcytosine-specific restriction endonuclease McrA